MSSTNKVWKTKSGETLNMSDMSPEHLQKAFTHVNSKMLHYHMSSCKLDELREQMEEVANERGIELKYPDEVFPSKKWGSYFHNIRKTDKMTVVDSTITEKAVEDKNKEL